MTGTARRASLVLLLIGWALPSWAAGPQLRWVASAFADAAGAPFSGPLSVACGSNVVAVADRDGRVVLLEPGDGGLSARAQWTVREASSPSRVEFGPDGSLFLLDFPSRRIVRVGPTGQVEGILRIPDDDDGRPVAVRSFAVSPEGTIAVLDLGSESVSFLDGSGRFARRVSLPGGGGYADLAFDPAGAVVVSGSGPAILLRATPGDDQAGAITSRSNVSAEMPSALAVRRDGWQFVLDRAAGTVLSVRRDGSLADRLLGFGWNSGQLRYPSDLCVDDSGRFFVADQDNRRVQMFALIE